MKNNKPLLGAVHIVGKDTNGNKIVLPTIFPMNHAPKDDSGKILYHLQTYAKRALKDAKNIIKDFKVYVADRALEAQEKYKKNKRDLQDKIDLRNRDMTLM